MDRNLYSSVLVVCNFTGLSSKRIGDTDEDMGKGGSKRIWQDSDPDLGEKYVLMGGGVDRT